MREFHKTIDKRMFDFEGFYQQIAEQLPDPCRIAEVGIANGASAIFLAEALLNLNKKFTFYLVDDFSYGAKDQFNDLLRNIGNADLHRYFYIMPYESLAASCHFPDHLFDFVFIDASHLYENTKSDIRLWYRKIIDGGILAGHDYATCPETKKAVDEVVVPSALTTITTDREFGIWSIRKDPDKKQII